MRFAGFSLSVITLAMLATPGFAAVYSVEDLGASDDVELVYGTASNGDITTANGQIRYESTYDVGDTTLFSAGDMSALFLRDGVATTVTGFDSFNDDGLRSGTTEEYLTGVTPSGVMVGSGSAPSYLYEYTLNDVATEKVVRDFPVRAFTTLDGVTISPVLPPYSETGGASRIYAVNDSNLAVGYASIGQTVGSAETYASCIEDSGSPALVCAQSVVYQLRAYAWQLDDNGAVTSGTNLGLPFTPADDDERLYSSQANAINSDGVAVGYASYAESSDSSIRTLATVYQDGQVSLIHDPEAFSYSYAHGISDANSDGVAYVVGQVPLRIDDYTYNKFFVYPLGAEGATLLHAYGNGGITDFYRASNSVARAANSNGQVVGWGEWEIAPNSQNRRHHGFLYDIRDNSFTDLNALIPCDSAYEIVDAVAIDENGEILAHALLKTDARDDSGELISGEQEYVVRTVRLTVTGGTSDQCPNEDLPTIERKGSSHSPWLLGVMLCALGFRRLYTRAIG